MSNQITRCCDLVMKGGITSGVLYPAAIEEIAKRFHLVGIGGTSAGAIAACGAAAAEYRRRNTGSFHGYEVLKNAGESLAQPGKLESLFQPDITTKKYFDDMLKVLRFESGRIKLAWLYFRRKKITQVVVDNGFGLCTGLANGSRDTDSPALTKWLADLIDEAAGKTDGPLTFQDLHHAPIPEAIKEKMIGLEARSIDLRLVTTSLTFGRPFEFPLSENIFAFDPLEWANFFPPRIIEHLKKAAIALLASSSAASKLNRDGKLPLPIEDLPVIVAARMSLSFPLLFTMIPLWCPNEDENGAPLQRVWFSDGGITSNFPIHRFDAIYPRWPTLGINLQYTQNKETVQRRRLREHPSKNPPMVFLPIDRKEAKLLPWNHFDGGNQSMDKVKGFAGAILQSARGWHDNSYLRLPSFQDRVAEIWLTEEEGGLNLNMDGKKVLELINRGREAGKLLAERFIDFIPSSEMSWDAHRWARFRSGMAGLMKCLLDIKLSAISDEEGNKMLMYYLESKDAPACFNFPTDEQQVAAQKLTENLLNFIDNIDFTNPFSIAAIATGGPIPPVELGTRAPI